MTDFGRRPGNMYRSVYDPGLLGYVWNSALLDQRTVAQVRGHTPQAHTHTEAQITDLVHDALAIKGVEVDDTDKDNEKILQYNSTSGKLEYETPGVGGAHKATHQDGGADEINCTALAGRVNFVYRGDPDFYDFELGDFTTDGNWNELDLSSIVPAGAVAALLRFAIRDDLVQQSLGVRAYGSSYNYNVKVVYTTIANVIIQSEGIVFLDSSRKIEYFASNTTWSLMRLLVRGWFI